MHMNICIVGAYRGVPAPDHESICSVCMYVCVYVCMHKIHTQNIHTVTPGSLCISFASLAFCSTSRVSSHIYLCIHTCIHTYTHTYTADSKTYIPKLWAISASLLPAWPSALHTCTHAHIHTYNFVFPYIHTYTYKYKKLLCVHTFIHTETPGNLCISFASLAFCSTCWGSSLIPFIRSHHAAEPSTSPGWTVCMYVCMYVCMHVYTHWCHTLPPCSCPGWTVCVYVCMYDYIYICLRVC